MRDILQVVERKIRALTSFLCRVGYGRGSPLPQQGFKFYSMGVEMDGQLEREGSH